MNRTQKPAAGRKPCLVVSGLFAAVIVLALLIVGGFVFAANQEGHDTFCASCHSQPETTFVSREAPADPVDLASYHTAGHARCIDCHSGSGLTGRVQAELLGARNAVKWYTGTAVQPAPLTVPFTDQNCLKCHQDVTAKKFSPKEKITAPGRGGGEEDEGGRLGHWHVNLARWQKTSPTAAACITCHPGHATSVNVQNGFMNDKNVRSTCSACHKVLRREGEGD